MGWTSIYQLFWCPPGVQAFDTLPVIYNVWPEMQRKTVKNCSSRMIYYTVFHVPIIFHSCLSWNFDPPGNSRFTLRSLALSETPEPPTSHRLRFIIYGVRAQATGECCAAGLSPIDIRKKRCAAFPSQSLLFTAVMCSSCTSFRSCLWIV